MENPLFLEFCLWLIHSTKVTSFPWEVETVREPLVTYIVGKIDRQYLHLNYIYALNMTDGLDPMVLDLAKDVLSRCSKTECLTLRSYWPIDELLSAVDPSLWCSQIHIICLDSHIYKRRELPERELQLLVRLDKWTNPLEMLPAVLEYCYRAKRRPCIDIDLAYDASLDLSGLFQINDIHQLHVRGFWEGAHVSCDQDIPPCPSLRQLSVERLENGDDVLSGLRKAIQDGHLPNLNYLGFPDCSFKIKGIPV